MHIRYGYKIDVICEQPTALVVMLDIHPSRRSDITEPDDIRAVSFADGAAVDTSQIQQDRFGNLCRRIMAPAGGVVLTAEGIVHDSGFADPQRPGAKAWLPEELPDDVRPFLASSPLCRSDDLAVQASALFGGLGDGWETVQAVCSFVHGHVRADQGQRSRVRTAVEVFDDRIGASRDHAHLALTLCRCLAIPARYCTGYLGAIGVAHDYDPMDFSAWFEAYLDGEWFTFDAFHNIPLIGRIMVARGRDASDVAAIDSFGAPTLQRIDILTEEVTGARFPVTSKERRAHWTQRSVESGSALN